METVIGIIGVLIAGLTFYYSFYKRPSEEINHLKAQFKATQRLSKLVQKDIQKYADITDSWDKQMFPNITFKAYLDLMKESFEENLSESLYDNISHTKLSKPNILSMTKSLERQFVALQEIQNRLKILYKSNSL